MKTGIIAQMAAWWPDSPEDLVEVLVSPPHGLILSAPLPGADWPLHEGAHGGNPPIPHLFNCISSFPYQSTTQQGKWREGKLKFTNRWEKERKRKTQGSGSTASQRCATEPHFHMRKNVIITASTIIYWKHSLYLNDLSSHRRRRELSFTFQ